jgi:hypothetical protein
MRRWLRGRAGIVLVFMLGLGIATAATAGASSLITGGQIKDGTIRAKDLSKGLRKQIKASRGSPGPTGPSGPAGASGLPGPPGPTVAGFATTNANVSLNPPGHEVRIMSLSSEGGGTITMPFAGRIFATGRVVAGTTDGGAGRVFCGLVLGPSGTALGGNGIVDVPATPNALGTIPMVGSVAVAAGTYDVSAQCLLNGPGAFSIFSGDMVVWGLPG